MSVFDQDWFSLIRRPSRYLGNEINTIVKDPHRTEVSVALVYPDVYDVGMSHLGLKILYHLLNKQDWLAAERVFSPWFDMEKEIRARGIGMRALETGRPLSEFDIVGFSLQHELSYTNVLNILELSDIPFLSNQRQEKHPLIIAGGPACFNPEPVAGFFDLFVIGDGEAATLEICRVLRGLKSKGKMRKKNLLRQLIQIRGVYVPSFFRIHYSDRGTIREIEPLVKGYTHVEKAIVADIDEYDYPEQQVVPFSELIHDRMAIEISRGCTRGCRFCQAGMIYRPVRERSPDSILRKAAKGLELTGYEDLSLLSLSTGDYGCIKPLLKALMDKQSEEKIALSLPSIRVDSMQPDWIDQIRRVRKTGFTLAPEAGSERLRNMINKGLSRRDILEMARNIYRAGWNLIKLYFMIGLPFEGEKDVHEIVALAKEIVALAGKRSKKPKLNLSVATFVPKSHTPFMWTKQISLNESRRRIGIIRQGLQESRVRVKWNQPELSWLEGIFSRGDRRLGRLVSDAYTHGARYDAWGEYFQMETWVEALSRLRIDPDFYMQRERPPEEIFPWDHIKSGVRKSYLRREWEKAKEGHRTSDCRQTCHECGVCDHKTVDLRLYQDWETPLREPPPAREVDTRHVKKYLLTFSKLEDARHLGHLELVRMFHRALRRAKLPLLFSGGYHPMPKVSFTCALPVGTESLQETLTIELKKTLDPNEVREKLNEQLPSGIRITSVEEVTRGRKAPRAIESTFLITVSGADLDTEALERFMGSRDFILAKRGKNGEKRINIRPAVKEMQLVSSETVRVTIAHADGPELRPTEIIGGVFNLNDNRDAPLRVLKLGQVLS
jgi:radical SAM family uncharacterized protein/radical SAM-linked protein